MGREGCGLSREKNHLSPGKKHCSLRKTRRKAKQQKDILRVFSSIPRGYSILTKKSGSLSLGRSEASLEAWRRLRSEGRRWGGGEDLRKSEAV